MQIPLQGTVFCDCFCGASAFLHVHHSTCIASAGTRSLGNGATSLGLLSSVATTVTTSNPPNITLLGNDVVSVQQGTVYDR
jgi:hypothetical protein